MIFSLFQCGTYYYGRIFFIGLLFASLILPYSAFAACPSGTKLTTDKRVRERLVVQDFALPAGSLSTSIDLNAAFATATLNLTDPTSLTQTIAIGPRPRYWRLRMPRNFQITSDDLTVSYEITGDNGQSNVISAPTNANSVVGVSVQSSNITTRRRGQRIRFFGSVVLALDLTTAQVSGAHKGSLTVTIDCF